MIDFNPVPLAEDHVTEDARDYRIIDSVEAGLPVSAIAAREGVSVEHVRQLMREVPE